MQYGFLIVVQLHPLTTILKRINWLRAIVGAQNSLWLTLHANKTQIYYCQLQGRKAVLSYERRRELLSSRSAMRYHGLERGHCARY